MDDDAEVLLGGVGNAGSVIRIGDEVRRPTSVHSSSIHALLAHLHRSGFDGVPEVLGIDSAGRERLGFIHGEVPMPPFPRWSQSDELLGSVAALLRGYHDAVAGFADGDRRSWSDEMADPTPGLRPVVCHNDLCPENVVFRDGRAVAMLDFEFAAPGRRLWDVASMASMCVPLDTDDDAARTGRSGLDPFRRLRVVADGYGLEPDLRAELVSVVAERLANGGAFVARRVERGEQAFIDMWEVMGGQERYDRRRRWFDEHRSRFVDELVSGL